ncbi:ATP-dependent DNA helicase RecG [Paeniglutamicibacter antarcticus]|uniref:Probable DNA 3'-5' helicase RecG n=1 Tax=Arthrobacter terrae TaxID=2935737 RepID=A0A931G7C9_9MICC|nr:ATP-dependent DNA helicase RecG [Arthrobacter terrae]MBG0739154.1 ATP-dependent DNA helicase RecG [Arthrobacter terrae]
MSSANPLPPSSSSGAQPSGPAEFALPLDRLIGKASATSLEKHLGLTTVGELLNYFPRRYLNRGELTPIDKIPVNEDVTIMARVLSVTKRRMRERKGFITDVVVTDDTGALAGLKISFFNGFKAEKELQPRALALFSGKVTLYNHARTLTNPLFELLPDDELAGHEAEFHAQRPLPVYSATAKLPSWKIQRVVETVLAAVDFSRLRDPLPLGIVRREKFVDLEEAYRQIHAPSEPADWQRARDRFRYQEALVLQTALVRRRAQTAAEEATARRGTADGLLAAFDAALPFTLTPGQQSVGDVLAAELSVDHPMNRLLQGEVGSGKTVVALRAMLQVIDSGGQAALLAPTEVLAAQHYQSIRAILGPLAADGILGGLLSGAGGDAPGGVNGDVPASTQVTLLTGSMPAAARKRALLDAASGTAGIIIGTHALLSDNVRFFDLGLIVVDEQHRFGVEQRDVLRNKAHKPPHLLVMTATPIPRTVAMTVFGDLEMSVLRELPAGRAPISTHQVGLVENPGWVRRIWSRAREEIDAGHQVYVVCPKIGDDSDDSDDSDGDDGGYDGSVGDGSGYGSGGVGGAGPLLSAASTGQQGASADQGNPAGRPAGASRPDLAEVNTVVEQLRTEPALAGARIEALHGRLDTEDKADTMAAFVAGDVDVLVSTTVIEVGVDVHNATMMVILDADRFGISQLHQLRGRVGRGGLPGTCLLVTALEPPHPSRRRLDAVAATTDGFVLSQEDLKLRREGDILGASQSGGRSTLRLLRVLAHEDIIARAREDAAEIVRKDPQLRENSALEAAIEAYLNPEKEAFLERG